MKKASIVINPAYRVKNGKKECNHKTTIYKFGNTVYEFCDECLICWVREL